MKKKVLLTIKQEMFLLGFASLILGSLVFVSVFFVFFFNSSLDNAKNTLHACNSQIVTYVEGVFHESSNLVDLLSKDQTVIRAGDGNKDAVITVFDTIHENNSNITYIYSGYSDGSLFINNYDAPSGYDVTNRPWYVASQQAQGVVRLAYSDAATGVWLFSHSKKLVDDSGNMVGAMCIDSSNENISRQLSAKYQYDSQRSFIIDLSGKVLIHPNGNEINTSLLSGRISEDVWQHIIAGKNNYAEYSQNDADAMAYFERIPNTDFIVVTAINSSEIIDPILHNVLYIVLLVIAISILLGFILSQILNYRFVRPIMELGDRIQGIANRKNEQQSKIKSSNAEINSIADSIEIIVRDIATQEEQRKAAEYLSLHDPMTGLYNRRYYEDALQRLDSSGNHPLCIVSCDINGLKLVNDIFGHVVGDRLITQVAESLDKSCRINDFTARIGGDEFAIVLPNTSVSTAEQFILRIKNGLLQQGFCGVVVSASFGFAIKNDPCQKLDILISEADEMMYAHKRVESLQMRNDTITNIINAGTDEGLIRPLSPQEEALLDRFAHELCPDLRQMLKDSYGLRKIGLCSLLQTDENNDDIHWRHTECGYRILSILDEYRGVSECILHYTEHWDGSGWPSGLSGTDIPLLSRIIAVTEGFCQRGRLVINDRGSLYDPDLVDMITEEH